MSKNLSGTNWGVRLGRLGYHLHGNVIDTFGRTWKLSTSPISGSGTIGYFATLGDMALYVRQLEEFRLMVEHPSRHAAGVELGIYPVARTMLPFVSR